MLALLEIQFVTLLALSFARGLHPVGRQRTTLGSVSRLAGAPPVEKARLHAPNHAQYAERKSGSWQSQVICVRRLAKACRNTAKRLHRRAYKRVGKAVARHGREPPDFPYRRETDTG
jgi:hypothetical protein